MVYDDEKQDFNNWCANYFGPDSDEQYVLDAVNNCPIFERLQSSVARLEAELVNESSRTAEQKLRADQLEQQHAMQAKMHAEMAEKSARLDGMCKSQCATMVAMTSDILAATDKVSELEKDAARFKWCSDKFEFNDFVTHATGVYCETIDDIRKSIDAAMQKP